MKKILATGVVGALILFGGLTATVQADHRGGRHSSYGVYSRGYHGCYGGHRGYWAGDLLAGVFIGSLLNGILAPPPYVVYPPAAYAPPVVYGPPYAACPPPVCYPPVVRYAPPPAVVGPTPYVPPGDTVWIQNSNGSRTPVRLRRTEGGMYIGPKGEYYQAMPTEDQLRQLYGM